MAEREGAPVSERALNRSQRISSGISRLWAALLARRGSSIVVVLCVGVVLWWAPQAEAQTVSVPCSPAALVGDLVAAYNAPGSTETLSLAAGCVYEIPAPSGVSPAYYGTDGTPFDWYGPAGLPAIDGTITIEGNGAVIDGGGPGSRYRLFYVGADPSDADTLGYTSPGAGSLTLEDLTVQDFDAQGGAAKNAGAGAGMGGVIFNQGGLTLARATAIDNTAQGGASTASSSVFSGGGGIGTDGNSDGAGGGFGPGNFGGAVGGVGSAGGGGGGGGGGFGASEDGQPGQASRGGAGGGPATGLGGDGYAFAGGSAGDGSGGGGAGGSDEVGGAFGEGSFSGGGVGAGAASRSRPRRLRRWRRPGR